MICSLPHLLRFAPGTAVLILLAALAPTAAAQTLAFTPESRLWIDGTSNKSDWTVEVSTLSGTVEHADGAVRAARLVVPVADLKSGKVLMDRLMHDTLMAEEHPQILFALDDADAEDGALTVSGQLTIAGTTNPITFPATVERLDGGRLRFTGETRLAMTEYGMKPPTAMFGALHTGDEVTIRFDAVAAPR